MPYVGNNVGQLISQAASNASRSRMAEGAALGQMYQNMGSIIGNSLQQVGMQKREKERDQKAAQYLANRFGVEDKDAKAAVKSVGAQNVDQFARLEMAKKQHEAQMQAAAKKQQEQKAVGKLVLESLNRGRAGPNMQAMARLIDSGISMGVDDYERARQMDQLAAAPKPGYESQEQAMRALGENPGNVTQDRKTGRWFASVSKAKPKDPDPTWKEQPVTREVLQSGSPYLDQGEYERVKLTGQEDAGIQDFMHKWRGKKFKSMDEANHAWESIFNGDEDRADYLFNLFRYELKNDPNRSENGYLE